LFLHICDRALQNRPDELREQQIGCAVFGRQPNYSPAEDNIVRVEVRQLRKRLDEYFSAEGKTEPYTIVIPKGTYVPVFEAYQAPVATPETPLEAPPAAPAKVRRHPAIRWLWVQSAAIVVLAATCLGLWQAGRRPEVRSGPADAPVDRGVLWPTLFNRGQQTFVICADSSLVVARAAKRRPITLDEYIAVDYVGRSAGLSPEVTSLLGELPRWLFTDIADLRVVQRLFRLNGAEWDKVSVRTARQTQIQDFKNGNAILLGSIRSNPWNELFEPMLNFQFEYEVATRTSYIRNKSPQAGEQPVYRASHPGEAGTFYSVIALVPNLRRNGSVLIVEGTAGDSTEATGEFITDPKRSGALLKSLMDRNRGRLPYFEVLLKSGTLAGVATDPEVVAIRVLSGEPGG
jgi:hypothetical protein